jgi:hypothetical protein
MTLSQTILDSIDFLKKKYYWAIDHHQRIYTSQELHSQNCIELTMGWTTLYITGKSDFREEVREKLEDSDLELMPGYTGTFSSDEEVHDLYWVDEKINLRAFKEAIGSKLIWKYRLQFYPSLEAFIESQNKAKSADLTPEDLALLAQMKAAARQRKRPVY